MATDRPKNQELTILKAAIDGDRSAIGSIYEAHIGYLTSVCSRYIADDEDVKDILQESFIKIFRSLGTFRYRGEGSLRAWMTRIVVNGALKHLRDSDRSQIVEFKESLPDTAEEEDADVNDVPPEQIQRMIRSLPVPYRTVFNLYVFQRMSHKEIADVLGMAPGTSASCLHRAKNMLVKLVNEYKNERDA